MSNLKQYCVTTKVYLWAPDTDNAVSQVSDYLNNEVDFGVSDIVGFISPTTADAVEIKEEVTK
jgi:hypothetical protein